VRATRATPLRRHNSVRRTTTHDCIRPEGISGPVTILARGRDLLTTVDGAAKLLDTAGLDMRVDYASGTIDRIAVDPRHPGLTELVGEDAFHRFRTMVAQAMPGERDSGSVRYQLLDDLPIALMLSGRALRAAGLGLNIDSSKPLPVDICAGWVAGGTLVAGLTEKGPPLHLGPTATAVKRDDDVLAWHQFGPLPPNGTRRHRRLDIWEDSRAAHVECFFRDTFADADGVETVVHEYTVHGTIDPVSSQFLSCEADAGPLPYPECPSAAGSAQRLEGLTVGGLRRSVRGDFVGPATCTHLNDTLRSLEDVGALLRMLRS
jgi:hypothetical protein